MVGGRRQGHRSDWGGDGGAGEGGRGGRTEVGRWGPEEGGGGREFGGPATCSGKADLVPLEDGGQTFGG